VLDSNAFIVAHSTVGIGVCVYMLCHKTKQDLADSLTGWHRLVWVISHAEFDSWPVHILVDLLSWLCEQVLDTTTMQKIMDKAQEAKEVSHGICHIIVIFITHHTYLHYTYALPTQPMTGCS
jgi:hypothetical protein